MQVSDADWRGRWPNFSPDEMRCRETGELNVSVEFMDKLQALRDAVKRPMVITSGYRSVKHSVEAKKKWGGWHTRGVAVDVSCDAQYAFDLLVEALKLGFHGVGVSQANGKPRFLHLDQRPYAERVLYSY